VVEFKADVLSN